VDDPTDTNDAAFTIACTGSSATAYSVKATGKTSKGMKDFVYEVNQAGAKKTSGAPSGWTTSGTCWVTQRDGSC
jgi:type IV pilus assembly protein PilE